MERTFEWLTRHGATLRNFTLIAILVAMGVFLYAAFRFGPTRASAWFQGQAVVLALIAASAASLAAVFTYPAYRDWWRQQQRVPLARLHVEVGNPTLANPTEVRDGGDHDIANGQTGFEVRVAVFNDGTATLNSGVLNICVPESCSIRPIDDPRIMHYLMPGTALNNVLEPDQVVKVRATIARDTFPPGIRMFHVEIQSPLGSSVPLVSVLAGETMTPMVHRITVTVAR